MLFSLGAMLITCLQVFLSTRAWQGVCTCSGSVSYPGMWYKAYFCHVSAPVSALHWWGPHRPNQRQPCLQYIKAVCSLNWCFVKAILLPWPKKKKKRPLRLCIKSEHYSYHAISAWSGDWHSGAASRDFAHRCTPKRNQARFFNIPWSEQCSDFMHNLRPGHTAAGFFDYHRNRPHSATVVKDTVAECGRFLSRQRESIICPERQIIDSASSCVSVTSGSESSSRCAPLGAGEETSRAISLEFAWKRNLLRLKTLSEGVLEFWISL